MPRKKVIDPEETKPPRKKAAAKKAKPPVEENEPVVTQAVLPMADTPDPTPTPPPQAVLPMADIPAPTPTPPSQAAPLENKPTPPQPAAPVLVSQIAAADHVPQTREQFDLNQIIATGVIHSVWGNSGDVFARVGLSTRDLLDEKDDTFTAYATLRFADGMVGGVPVTLQPGDILTVQGYLVHRNYTESLRKFLEDADAIHFLDSVDPKDLPAWRTLALERRNGIVNVLSMTFRTPDGEAADHFGEPLASRDLSRSSVEGIVSRAWEYRNEEGVDLFVRLAVYDPHTPVDAKSKGNFGRPRRLAHYVNIRFPLGKTASGAPVHITQKMRIRVVGQLRDKAQVVTLREVLFKTGSRAVIEMMQRVSDAERMSEIKNQQESLHIRAQAVVVYSAGHRR